MSRRIPDPNSKRRRARYVSVVREAGRLWVQVQTDLGTPERANQEDGVAIGQVRTQSGAWGRGAYAIDQLEGMRQRGELGPYLVASERLEAAEAVRRVIERAKLRRAVTGGYLLRAPGSAGVDLKAEAREEQARLKLQHWARLVGSPALNLLIDVLGLGQTVPRGRIPEMVHALDRIAVDLRL